LPYIFRILKNINKTGYFKSKNLCYNKIAVLHGVLQTLDPKLMRGAEPIVRALKVRLNLITVVDSSNYGGVKFRTVSGRKLSSTKKIFAGVINY